MGGSTRASGSTAHRNPHTALLAAAAHAEAAGSARRRGAVQPQRTHRLRYGPDGNPIVGLDDVDEAGEDEGEGEDAADGGAAWARQGGEDDDDEVDDGALSDRGLDDVRVFEGEDQGGEGREELEEAAARGGADDPAALAGSGGSGGSRQQSLLLPPHVAQPRGYAPYPHGPLTGLVVDETLDDEDDDDDDGGDDDDDDAGGQLDGGLYRDVEAGLLPAARQLPPHAAVAPRGHSSGGGSSASAPTRPAASAAPFFRADEGGMSASVIVGPGVFYLGIIDILQEYNVSKRVERAAKTTLLLQDPDGVSVAPPAMYADRFLRRVVHEIIDRDHSGGGGGGAVVAGAGGASVAGGSVWVAAGPAAGGMRRPPAAAPAVARGGGGASGGGGVGNSGSRRPSLAPSLAAASAQGSVLGVGGSRFNTAARAPVAPSAAAQRLRASGHAVLLAAAASKAKANAAAAAATGR